MGARGWGGGCNRQARGRAGGGGGAWLVDVTKGRGEKGVGGLGRCVCVRACLREGGGVSARFPQEQCGAAVHAVTRQRGSKSKAAHLMNIKQRVLLSSTLPPSLSNHRAAAEAAGCTNPLSPAQNERRAETRRRGQGAHAITTKAAL